MSNEDIIKRLLGIEAWAEKLTKECRETRRLIQAEVSTVATAQQALSEEQKAEIIKKRFKRNTKLRIA